ncbi:MAG: hypothetical protein ACRC1Z_08595 [Waterburya sp.]
MGRWCEVKCNCPNRDPLPGSGIFDEPYRKRKRLTIQEQIDRDNWHENIKGMFTCGHRDGVIIQLSPGELFIIGNTLDKVYKDQEDYFKVFRKISHWRNYTNEYLALSQDEVMLWQLEIEQLQRYLSEEEYMGWHQYQILNEYLNNQTLSQDSLQTILGDGLALCAASEKTGNPVEFFW